MPQTFMGTVLVTGATGMLGRYVLDELRKLNISYVAPDRARCDLSDPSTIYSYIRDLRPDAIMHLAAETDVDMCEREPRRAGILNHLATQAIAQAARASESWLLYVSTSNVFGADCKSFYNELDVPAPVNYYGRSKLHGEHAARLSCPESHLILRAGWMIGGGPEHDHKFVGKVIRQISGGLGPLRAVTDKFGSLTRADALADFAVSSLLQRRTGTLHFCSRGVVSRFDIAMAICEILQSGGPVEGVTSAQFPLSAPRPYSEGMDSLYVPLAQAPVAPSFWRDDLRSYVSLFKV